MKAVTRGELYNDFLDVPKPREAVRATLISAI